MWVFEPDTRMGVTAWELMVRGKRMLNKDGAQQTDERGQLVFGDWHLSDLDIVTEMFTVPYTNNTHNRDRYFPFVNDYRHGIIPGLRKMPEYASMTDKQYEDVVSDPRTRVSEQLLSYCSSTLPRGCRLSTPAYHAMFLYPLVPRHARRRPSRRASWRTGGTARRPSGMHSTSATISVSACAIGEEPATPTGRERMRPTLFRSPRSHHRSSNLTLPPTQYQSAASPLDLQLTGARLAPGPHQRALQLRDAGRAQALVVRHAP